MSATCAQSHVRRVDGIKQAGEDSFRERSNSHLAGVLGRPALDYPKPDDLPITGCGPLCDFRDCEVCQYIRFDPSILINPVDGRILVGANDRFSDVSHAFSSGLRSSLVEAGGGRWLGAEEPVEVRRTDTVQLVVLSPAADQTYALAQRVDGAFVDARAQVEPGVGAPQALPSHNLLLGSDGAPMAPGLTGSQLVLSANERAVFSVGGQRNSEVGVEPAGVLRLSTLQRDYADPVWEPVGFELDFGRMLALTYAATERALYSLDEQAGVAHLRRLDLQTLGVQELGAWPLGSSIDSIYLSSTFDGQLLLSSTGDATYRVDKFQVVNGALVTLWEVFGNGTLVTKPQLKRTGLDVTVVNGGNGVRRAERVAEPAAAPNLSLGRCLK